MPVILAVASLVVMAQAVAPPPAAAPQPPSQNVSPAAPQNASPPKPTVEPTPDPASSHFLTEAGILLVAIKPAGIPDYELAIRSLQEALSKSTDATKAAAAKGWRIYKADTDAKGNQYYVHIMMPTVTGFDYRPSLLLDELLKDMAPELLFRYQEAFAMPPTKLSLIEFAHMAVAPLPQPDPTKPDPAKPDPAKPEPKKPPG